MAPVKYKCDSISGTFATSKLLLTEKLTNGALVAPTSTILIHCVWANMGFILQTTFWNQFSCMKSVVFEFNFHWNVLSRTQLTICQLWSKYWLGAESTVYPKKLHRVLLCLVFLSLYYQFLVDRCDIFTHILRGSLIAIKTMKLKAMQWSWRVWVHSTDAKPKQIAHNREHLIGIQETV